MLFSKSYQYVSSEDFILLQHKHTVSQEAILNFNVIHNEDTQKPILHPYSHRCSQSSHCNFDLLRNFMSTELNLGCYYYWVKNPPQPSQVSLQLWHFQATSKRILGMQLYVSPGFFENERLPPSFLKQKMTSFLIWKTTSIFF